MVAKAHLSRGDERQDVLTFLLQMRASAGSYAARDAISEAIGRIRRGEHAEPAEPIAGKVVEFAMGGIPGLAFNVGCTADECALMVVVPAAAVSEQMGGSILNAAVSITLAEVAK